MIRKRVLQVLMAALGTVLVVRFAVPGILNGGQLFAGDGPVDVLLDSEFRFLSVLAGAMGIIFFWMIPRIDAYGAILRIVAFASFAGGLARLLSMFQHGLPPNKALIATGIELIVPVIILILHWSVIADSRPRGG